MKENLKNAAPYKVILLPICLFLVVVLFGNNPWHSLMLTAAQLVYVPLCLKLILQQEDWFYKFYKFSGWIAYVAIMALHTVQQPYLKSIVGSIWLIFTVLIGIYGLTRFLQRGFSNLEEFMIDMGLMYLPIGGAWFFAYLMDINTGFSPMMTWLTAVHFHYSSFLLPIFTGFLGRLVLTTKLYLAASLIIIFSPILVAIGISFSIWIEVVSVFIYIFGIYGLVVLAFNTNFNSITQKWLIRVSFFSLAITILFSLAYALGNLIGKPISIDFMLRSHGILNSFFFAFFGLIGWSLRIPPAKRRKITFPVSQIKGGRVIGDTILIGNMDSTADYPGLVDTMKIYEPDISTETIAPTIIDFYEHTQDYRLFATVKWQPWFKPFAFIYRMVSKYMKQLNLPLSGKKAEMTGEIVPIQEKRDGRIKPRAWVRRIDQEVTFLALYSLHKKGDRTFMNIALPLPWTSMIGILELKQTGNQLQLTSKRLKKADADSGIYLSLGNSLFQLPLEEMFQVTETQKGILKAHHQMWILSIPFLSIEYEILHKDYICN